MADAKRNLENGGYRTECTDWCHAAIYMGWGKAWEGSKAGEWTELRSQHSPDRCRVWWWEDVPNGTYLRLWHVIY